MNNEDTEYGFNYENDSGMENFEQEFYRCVYNVKDAFNTFNAGSILEELEPNMLVEIKQWFYDNPDRGMVINKSEYDFLDEHNYTPEDIQGLSF